MDRLPAALWTLRQDLAELVAALGPGAVRWVGGAVRDTLLNHPVEDIDAATLHEPAQVVERLERAGIRTIPTGIDHGTITALLDHGPVEVTTLRRDVSTDGRRATVAFATNWRDDASRRDFTINALYVDPETLEIYDYFNGLSDLAEGRVRFIGDARERIAEDHLRILRYFRFQCRFGSALDEEAEAACIALATTLKGLSRERVAGELLRLLALPDPGPTIRRMIDNGVLQIVLPELREDAADRLEALIAQEARQGVAGDGVRRMAALLPSQPRVAEQVAARLRMSVAQRKRLGSAAAPEGAGEEGARALDYRIGREKAIDRLLLAGAEITPLAGWETPQLPLRGGEIVQRGIAAGPQVASLLGEVERRWIAEGFPSRERVEMLLDEALRR